jgi:DNA-binding transcriptional ArsR family regulator
MAITNGMDFLLTALHPKVSWHSSMLEIASDVDADLDLDGRGLVLSPSLFLEDKSCVVLEYEKQTGMPVLVFAVPVDLDELETTEDEFESGGDRALGALVGATRAAALRALAESGTTGDLSDRLGISLSGASKQATVLREAGLITTLRNRTTAVHTLTPLGVALLQRKIPVESLDELAAVPAVTRR